MQPLTGSSRMGHEHCGFVERAGSAVRRVKPGQFVVGPFAVSGDLCPTCTGDPWRTGV
ncbi:MAG TPA: alcohol dehydrogenase catalytic domain-containing protein [Burkholderiales bacterium]|nr:alcohol dehydrogenase catalytic domain-containing protein [Burkholderiales bacterium]